MKYFKKVTSYKNLKAQYKELLKQNHPDNGGDVEVMKEINVQFDALFGIWKNRRENETDMNETADGIRSQFYTEFGWEGKKHDWTRSLKEVAQIVRAYVKEKYPTYKFSVRTSYASMCQELHVDLRESPIEIYKTFKELTEDEIQEIAKKIYPWDYLLEDKLHFLNASEEEQEKIIEESTSNHRRIINEVTKSVIDDIDAFVNSYNFHDCDGMIDYFHVDFYYFGCCRNNGANVKIVPKTARIRKVDTIPAKNKAAESKAKQLTA